MTVNNTKIHSVNEPVFRSKELKREYRTVEKMIGLYCRQNHGHTFELCDDCGELLKYAEQRISKCPHYKSKIPCKDCTIHCYQEPYKSKIRKVMRYAGPRMITRHPILALFHILARFKKDTLKSSRRERDTH